jgi:ribosomal protein S18 acetylase RimI-like enzyme
MSRCHDLGVEIRRVDTPEAFTAAGHLFDSAPLPEPTRRFLSDDRHHLLVAYLDSVPAGFVTGVEMTHPDKGTEMFIYELGVDEPFQARGVGKALVAALGDLARERGCYGMWVVTDGGNAAALATYRTGSVPEAGQVVLAWTFDEAVAGQSAPGR